MHAPFISLNQSRLKQSWNSRLLRRIVILCTLTSALSCSDHTADQSLQGNEVRWPSFEGAPGASLKTFAYGKQQPRTATGAALTDIVSHLPSSYGNTYYDSDVVTWGHETSHGIHSHLRNNFNTTGRKANGFYLMNDTGVVIAEPKVLKRRVAEFVPSALRGSRFALYVTGQTAWDDTPTYILDEFNAYVNGAEVAIDLHKNNLWTYGNRDALEGMMEFVTYSLALGAAVQKYDPEYFVTYKQFSEFLAFDIERAMRLFRAGAGVPAFQRESQEKLFNTLRSGPEGAPLRDFALQLFGSEWVNRVLLAPLPNEGASSEQSQESPATVEDQDQDQDGISDRVDQCPNTPAKETVWTYGDWIGCAEGEERKL